MTTMCSTAARPRGVRPVVVKQLTTSRARTIRTTAGRAARTGTPLCILRKPRATSGRKSRAMLLHGRARYPEGRDVQARPQRENLARCSYTAGPAPRKPRACKHDLSERISRDAPARPGPLPESPGRASTTSARESRAMLLDGAVGQHAQQLLDRGGSREQPLVRVLGHAVGGAPRAFADLVEGRPPGDQAKVLIVRHPQVGHHHASLVAAEAAGGAARPPVEDEVGGHRLEELVQRGWRRGVILAAVQADPAHEPL